MFRCFLFIAVLLSVNCHPDIPYSDLMHHHWDKEGEKEIEKALLIKHNTQVAKNVILFVGDGMGPNTITASRVYSVGEEGRLAWEEFEHVGILKTYAVDKTVPDSAATATALFSGVKTNFEVVGVDGGVKLRDCEASLKQQHRVKSISTYAQKAGKHTGFITNTRVTHATPAALYSHSADRKWECDASMLKGGALCKDIARQLVEDEPGNKFQVIMGGGRQCLTWNYKNTSYDPVDMWACRRQDGRDLIEQWRKDKKMQGLNCKVLETTQDLTSLDHNTTDCIMGIFANTYMSYEYKRDTSPQGTPSLSQMVQSTINQLSKHEAGFVLIVEGGMIDQAHHRGHARIALDETVALSQAVQVAVNFSNARSARDTLIIVTSDHAHNLNINGYPRRGTNITGIAMNSKQDGLPFTTLTYAIGGPKNYKYHIDGDHVARNDPATENTTEFTYSQQAGIVNDEATHGGVDVAVYATGPMSHLFHGLHEQSYVAHVVQYAARIGKYHSRSVPQPPTHSGTSQKESSSHVASAATSYSHDNHHQIIGLLCVLTFSMSLKLIPARFL